MMLKRTGGARLRTSLCNRESIGNRETSRIHQSFLQKQRGRFVLINVESRFVSTVTLKIVMDVNGLSVHFGRLDYVVRWFGRHSLFTRDNGIMSLPNYTRSGDTLSATAINIVASYEP